MIKIKPFPALIYNRKKIRQIRKLICPPYDIINPTEARFYRRLSRYNMIHLTLPERDVAQNRYRKASCVFRDWLKKDILLQDKEPAVYFLQEEFKIGRMKNSPRAKDTTYRRLGFIACLNLSSSSSIYGHEHTRIEPKEDRFKLLVKMQANLEPIFVLFPDAQGFLGDVFKKHVAPYKPLICFRDQWKNMNTLWGLRNPSVLKKLNAWMTRKILFIADGHHRYEVSLSYQDLMQREFTRRPSSANLRATGENGFNYIMVYFCPIESPGLVIRPVHRLVRGVEPSDLNKFEKFFRIRKATRRELFCLLESSTPNPGTIGAYLNGKFYIFILKSRHILNKIDKEYRALDIALLNHLVFKRLLKIRPDDQGRIIFGANSQELIRQADRDKKSLVFFMKPVRINDIISTAKAGKKMPAKTTYFYPKIPSGLVVYKFNSTI